MLVHELFGDTVEVAEFLCREWRLADIEHYGGVVDFDKRSLRFLAKNDNDEILAFLELMIEADLAKVETLLVGKNHRRKGVGKFLMEFGLDYCRKQGCKKIWLETNAGWDAEKFYESLGYEVEARLKKHILGQDALIFVRFL